MRVAVAVWNGRVSPVFDGATRVMFCDLEGTSAVNRIEEALEPGPPWRRVERIAAAGAEVLICGAISRPLADMVLAAGIRLHPFVSGEVDEVLRAFASGRLDGPTFAMPGCRRRRHRFGARGRWPCR